MAGAVPAVVPVWAGLALAACAGSAGGPSVSGPPVSIRVAPLSLPGVGVACYDVEVSNGTDVVWSQGDPDTTRLGGDTGALCSDRYGNGPGGDIAYVGTCDASTDADPSKDGIQNLVTLWVDGLYDAGVTADVGQWRDPCLTGCTLSVDCDENADSLVRFDLTIMRDANQGFFDVAVSFEDVFCSAKLDTCYGESDPITLLFGGDDTRDRTGVFGFACSAGVNADTRLAYGVVTVTCGETTFVVDPTRGPGEVSVTAGGHTLHYGVYRGAEALDCGPGPGSCAKLYWNLALDLDDLAALGTCRLALSATATDDDQGFTAGLPTDPGVSYPYIDVDATLTSAGAVPCQQHPLGDGPVQPVYHGAPGDGALGGLDPAEPLCWEFDGAAATTVPGTFLSGTTCAACDATATYAGGTGTLADPYLICARSHLEHVALDLGAHYRQVADLDLGAADFTPLGPGAFTGSYDGGGHALANLTVAAPTDPLPIGLFRELGVGARVHDVALVDVDLTGNNFVGGIAGKSSGVVTDVSIAGSLVGKATVGGVVGHQTTSGALVQRATVRGTIYSSASGTAIVTIGGGGLDTGAGGIAGIVYDGGAVRDCTVDGAVTWDPEGPGHAQAWTYAGGIAGYGNGAQLTGNRVAGSVTGKLQVGGVLGASDGDATLLSDCHSTATVTGDSWVGGLVGATYGTLTRVSAQGDVTGRWDVGGLIGTFAGGVIREAYATGDVTGGEIAGGLVGRDISFRPYPGQIIDAWASGAVSVSSATGIGGGLVALSSSSGARGYYPPVFTNCYALAPSVTGVAGATLGGLQGLQVGEAVRTSNYLLEGAAVPPQTLAGLTTITAAQATQASSFVGFAFGATWRMALTNPLSPYTPALATAVLAWQCGQDGVTCAP